MKLSCKGVVDQLVSQMRQSAVDISQVDQIKGELQTRELHAATSEKETSGRNREREDLLEGDSQCSTYSNDDDTNETRTGPTAHKPPTRLAP